MPTKPTPRSILSNTRFRKWGADLQKVGIQARVLREEAPFSVVFLAGELEHRTNRPLTVVLQDHGEAGFTTFLESPFSSIEQEVSWLNGGAEE